MTLWLVRAGKHGEGESFALTNSVVGIGFAEFGDLSKTRSLDDIRKRIEERRPDAKPSTVTNWAGQVDAFIHRIKEGDLVALPLKSAPAVAFGRVTGGYRFVPDASDQMRHQRPVKWIREDVPRSEIDQDLLYSLGAFLTVCQIKRNNAEKRIEALLEGKQAPERGTKVQVPSDEGQEAAPVDLDRLSRDQISKRIAARFHGHELAQLVGDILRAEGFVTNVSPAGPDGGVDILAGQGSMGFDGAMLTVQVKSGAQQVDAPTLRELQGVMKNFGATRGLMVSWGGFTKSARAEARRLFFEIRLWDSDALIDKIIEVYERLPGETRAELPLRRIWTLVPEETE
jgi:restriction system protein